MPNSVSIYTEMGNFLTKKSEYAIVSVAQHVVRYFFFHIVQFAFPLYVSRRVLVDRIKKMIPVV